MRAGVAVKASGPGTRKSRIHFKNEPSQHVPLVIAEHAALIDETLHLMPEVRELVSLLSALKLPAEWSKSEVGIRNN